MAAATASAPTAGRSGLPHAAVAWAGAMPLAAALAVLALSSAAREHAEVRGLCAAIATAEAEGWTDADTRDRLRALDLSRPAHRAVRDGLVSGDVDRIVAAWRDLADRARARRLHGACAAALRAADVAARLSEALRRTRPR